MGAIEVLSNVEESIAYDIYGPIENQQYWGKCRQKIKTLPMHIQVNYRGPLSPKDVVHTAVSNSKCNTRFNERLMALPGYG